MLTFFFYRRKQLFYVLVLFNLLDIPHLIERGWAPVLETSNAILTENLLPTLDIISTNITEITDIAIRTPLTPQHRKATFVHVKANSKSADTFRERKLLSLLLNKLFSSCRI